MPEIDLSAGVPGGARWIKVRYEMRPLKEGADLVARLWSGGTMDDAVVVRGASGDAFVRLGRPQKLSYQNPAEVDLKLKVVAYKITEGA